MKYIAAYQLWESFPSELTPEQGKWVNKHTRGTWNYDPQTGLVNVNGTFDCSDPLYPLTNFKGVRFGVVTKSFICPCNNLESLEGAPSVVGGNFDCYDNNLTSLKGAPQKVGGDFICHENRLTSLEGAPQEVGGGFYCSSNELISLKGAPQAVGGYFDCSHNELISLEEAPREVGGYFDCSHNELISLKGAPRETVSTFDCTGNKLESLEGAPESLSELICLQNPLTSLEGFPRRIRKFKCDAFRCHVFDEPQLSTFIKVLNGEPGGDSYGWADIEYVDKGKAKSLALSAIPLDKLSAYIKANPLDLDLLDEVPEVKKEVLQRTGLKDMSGLAKTIRKGIL
jgi:hypothetical protein